MNGWIKTGILVLFFLSLSSCSVFGNKWFGGKDKCVDGACEETGILDNRQSTSSWYCYGVQQDRSWDCTKEPQSEKKVTVIVESNQSVAPVTTTVAPATTTVAPVITTVASAITAEVVEETVAEQADNPVPPAAEPGDGATIRDVNSETGAEVILNQPGDFFAVQLIAMKEENKILEFAVKNGIESPLYVRIQSQNTDWYALLLGTYPDRSSAEKAKADWEGARVLKIQPWIRRLTPLQDAIRLALGQ